MQRWFPDWPAAPVFYVDQGIISRTGVYVGRDTSKGVAAWLRAMAKHKVKVVLIDTVDKAKAGRFSGPETTQRGCWARSKFPA